MGAGSVGMETAEYLIGRGHHVIVADFRTQAPVMTVSGHGYFLHQALKEGGGEMLLRTKVTAVIPEGAVVSTDEGEKELAVDTVVWAVGAVSEKAVAEQAKKAGVKVVPVGDAVKPRRMLEAIHEGQKAAEQLLYD